MTTSISRSRFEHWLLKSSGIKARSTIELDGLRGIAVLMVFLTHAWSFSGSPDMTGTTSLSLATLLTVMNTGVDLFFVMSGYLLSMKFLSAAHGRKGVPSLRQYARERCYRIFPLYWFVLALVPLIMTPWLVKESDVFSIDGFMALLVYIPMLSAFFPWTFGHFFVISPVWTLTVELFFYMLVPFAYVFFLGRRWVVSLALSLVISLSWLAFLKSSVGTEFAIWFGSIGSPSVAGRDLGRIILASQLPTFAFAFATGVSVASIVSRRNQVSKREDQIPGSKYLVPSGVIVIFVILWLLGSIKRDITSGDPFIIVRSSEPKIVAFYFLQHIAPVLGFGLVLAGIVLDGRSHRIIGALPLRIVGILGYGIYLWHFPVLFSQTWISWLAALDPAIQFPVAVAFGGATTFGLSLLTWFALERPWMIRGKESVSGSESNHEIRTETQMSR